MAEPAPWTYPPIVSRDSEEIWWPHWQRYDGSNNLEPLTNSANGLFPKPRVKPISIGVILISMYKQTYTDADYYNQNNTLNNATWRSWPAGHAWIARILTEDVKENDYDCVKVDYVVKCNKLGWDKDFLQCGYYYLSGLDRKHFLTDDLDPIPYIGLLDASGGELGVGGTAVVADDKSKVWIDFTSLGI